MLFVIGRTWGDTLVETDPATGAALPALAESWTSTPQADVWTFKLRQGVKFHDGTGMTVNDVVQTIRRHTDEGTKSGALGMLRSIKTVEDQGGDLVVTLTEGNADLPLILSDYHLIVQPNGGFDKPDAAIGTGPYKLTSYQAGVRATFEKNADDWRDDRGFVDSVELIVMNDTTARIAAVSSGQVHFINAVEPKTVKLLEAGADSHDPAHGGQGLLLLPRLLRHRAVRQQRFATGAEVRDRPAGDPRPYPRRLRHARQRLSGQRELRAGARRDRAAGLRSGEGGLPLQEVGPFWLHPAPHGRGGLSRRRRRGRALPGEREDRGHQHRGEAGARRRLLDQRLERAALRRLLLGGRPTQDLRYTTSFVSTAEWNDTRFKREDFDALIVKARSELDQDKRKALYKDAAVMVRDEGGIILPVFNDYLNASTKNLMGFVDDIGNDTSNGYVASRVWLAS